MDLSAILPLLLQTQGAKGTDSKAGSEQDDTSTDSKKGGGLNPAQLLSMMNGMNNGGKMDSAELIKTLMPDGGGGNLAQVMSLASAMNQNQPKRKKAMLPSGIKPIKQIAGNDIIGKIVKFFE